MTVRPGRWRSTSIGHGSPGGRGDRRIPGRGPSSPCSWRRCYASSAPSCPCRRPRGWRASRFWTLLGHDADEAHAEPDWSGAEIIAGDETSTKKGHTYLHRHTGHGAGWPRAALHGRGEGPGLHRRLHPTNGNGLTAEKSNRGKSDSCAYYSRDFGVLLRGSQRIGVTGSCSVLFRFFGGSYSRI